MPYEALVKLEFITPCLGNERRNDPEPNRMLRSSSGSVIFLQSWWWACTNAAADRFNMHQQRIRLVRWSAEIDGTTKLYDRYYQTKGSRLSKKHEAFVQGDVIGARALVPDDIPLSDFKEILNIAGTYFGLSPFGWKRGFGKFKVVEVSKVYGRSIAKDQRKHAGDISDNQEDNRDPISNSDIHEEDARGPDSEDGV